MEINLDTINMSLNGLVNRMYLKSAYIMTALAVIAMVAILPGCKDQGPTKEQQQIVETESDLLNAWFEQRFDEEVLRSPISATRLGLDQHQDLLDDTSRLYKNETNALTETWLSELRQKFDRDRLDPKTKLSFRLYEYAAEDRLETARYDDHIYIFQHMSGPHTSLPAFMSNSHSIENRHDALNYIRRLEQFGSFLGEQTAFAETQAQNGVLLPRFVYPKIREAAENIISGKPFEQKGESPLWQDITSKIDRLELESDIRDDLRNGARNALMNHVKPAYDDIINMSVRHEAMADENDGAWKLPDGANFYQSRLKHYTSTDLTADEIHQIGLNEVARIKSEMQVIMDDLGFDGTTRQFFDKLRTDPEYLYDNSDEGRAAYMDRATKVIGEMKGRMDELFVTKPKADVIVKRVEPYREASAFGAFYNEPSVDGNRPGTYYINLKDMNDLPIYQLQALAYHEGIPGHHMQIAIAQELQGLPRFRTLGGHTPYIEGWALYAERIPKELGLYTDPYQDFGRLSMEIFRAARLVVDTGIHAKKWTRSQAVEYMMENTANAEGDIRAEVDRYIVWPGQATAYKIGMLKIDELRTKAESELGESFDIREFHDVILANGSVPLSILDELVTEWIAQKKS